MKTLITALLISHVTLGTIALLIGVIPMFSKKGSPLHSRTGQIYVWSMTYVASSAALLFVLQPFTIFRLFLAGIAVFSFYLSTTGWRAVKQKKTGFTPIDQWLTYGTLIVSLGMIGYGLFLVSRSVSFMSILFTFFGVLTFTFAIQDFRQFGKSLEKMQRGAAPWFFQHFTRMGGSYIAAFTAFLVNNGRMFPAGTPEWVYLAGWIAPSVIGGMLIGRTVAYYKKKFTEAQRVSMPRSA